jgi:hypothetical protein
MNPEVTTPVKVGDITLHPAYKDVTTDFFNNPNKYVGKTIIFRPFESGDEDIIVNSVQIMENQTIYYKEFNVTSGNYESRNSKGVKLISDKGKRFQNARPYLYFKEFNKAIGYLDYSTITFFSGTEIVNTAKYNRGGNEYAILETITGGKRKSNRSKKSKKTQRRRKTNRTKK